MSAGLTLTAVAITRGRRHLVDGLSLDAPPGTLVAIIGVAGSGKSAVLDAIAGHRRVDAGTVTVDGRVAYVSQAHDLIPTLTALENVALAALASGATPDDSWQRAAYCLDRLGLPAAAQANLAEELSGGQHQRVALARALTADAAVVVADDPTSELDEASVDRAVDAIREVLANGAVVVVATGEPRLLAAAGLIVDLDAGAVSG